MDVANASYTEAIRLNPKNPMVLNNLAWYLATWPDTKFRNPNRAVELARKVVEIAPNDGIVLNTLGTALYRTGDWKGSVTALEKSLDLMSSHKSFNWFFLAMANWQLGHKDEARKWYDKAVLWMDKNMPKDEELRRFRAEAAELMNIKEEITKSK